MGETKSRKVQVKQRQSLVDAFRLKAGAKNLSMNQAANEAIQQYIKSGGENIVAEKDRRLLLLLPESMYNSLSELAKAQGISVNKAVESAMVAYITGEQTDNTKNLLAVYMSRTWKLSGKVRRIVSVVNETYGGLRDMMADINELKKKKTPKSREKEKYEGILTEVDRLWIDVEKMVAKVDEIHQESEFDD